MRTHLETLLLLTSTRDGRQEMRSRGVYFVVRELHLGVEDEGVREGCERLVQVLMRDEEGEGEEKERGEEKRGMRALGQRGGINGGGGERERDRGGEAGRMVTQADVEEDSDEDEDEKVVEIF